MPKVKVTVNTNGKICLEFSSSDAKEWARALGGADAKGSELPKLLKEKGLDSKQFSSGIIFRTGGISVTTDIDDYNDAHDRVKAYIAEKFPGIGGIVFTFPEYLPVKPPSIHAQSTPEEPPLTAAEGEIIDQFAAAMKKYHGLMKEKPLNPELLSAQRLLIRGLTRDFFKSKGTSKEVLELMTPEDPFGKDLREFKQKLIALVDKKRSEISLLESEIRRLESALRFGDMSADQANRARQTLQKDIALLNTLRKDLRELFAGVIKITGKSETAKDIMIALAEIGGVTAGVFGSAVVAGSYAAAGTVAVGLFSAGAATLLGTVAGFFSSFPAVIETMRHSADASEFARNTILESALKKLLDECIEVVEAEAQVNAANTPAAEPKAATPTAPTTEPVVPAHRFTLESPQKSMMSSLVARSTTPAKKAQSELDAIVAEVVKYFPEGKAQSEHSAYLQHLYDKLPGIEKADVQIHVLLEMRDYFNKQFSPDHPAAKIIDKNIDARLEQYVVNLREKLELSKKSPSAESIADIKNSATDLIKVLFKREEGEPHQDKLDDVKLRFESLLANYTPDAVKALQDKIESSFEDQHLLRIALRHALEVTADTLELESNLNIIALVAQELPIPAGSLPEMKKSFYDLASGKNLNKISDHVRFLMAMLEKIVKQSEVPNAAYISKVYDLIYGQIKQLLTKSASSIAEKSEKASTSLDVKTIQQSIAELMQALADLPLDREKPEQASELKKINDIIMQLLPQYTGRVTKTIADLQSILDGGLKKDGQPIFEPNFEAALKAVITACIKTKKLEQQISAKVETLKTAGIIELIDKILDKVQEHSAKVELTEEFKKHFENPEDYSTLEGQIQKLIAMQAIINTANILTDEKTAITGIINGKIAELLDQALKSAPNVEDLVKVFNLIQATEHPDISILAEIQPGILETLAKSQENMTKACAALGKKPTTPNVLLTKAALTTTLKQLDAATQLATVPPSITEGERLVINRIIGLLENFNNEKSTAKDLTDLYGNFFDISDEIKKFSETSAFSTTIKKNLLDAVNACTDVIQAEVKILNETATKEFKAKTTTALPTVKKPNIAVIADKVLAGILNQEIKTSLAAQFAEDLKDLDDNSAIGLQIKALRSMRFRVRRIVAGIPDKKKNELMSIINKEITKLNKQQDAAMQDAVVKLKEPDKTPEAIKNDISKAKTAITARFATLYELANKDQKDIMLKLERLIKQFSEGNIQLQPILAELTTLLNEVRADENKVFAKQPKYSQYIQNIINACMSTVQFEIDPNAKQLSSLKTARKIVKETARKYAPTVAAAALGEEIPPTTFTASDIEGRFTLLQKVVDNSGGLMSFKTDKSGYAYIDFKDPTAVNLLLNGDLYDHGPDAFYIWEILDNTMQHYKDINPDIFELMLGNRELNKLRFATELNIDHMLKEFAAGESITDAINTKRFELKEALKGKSDVEIEKAIASAEVEIRKGKKVLPFWDPPSAKKFHQWLSEHSDYKEKAEVLRDLILKATSKDPEAVQKLEVYYLQWMLAATMGSGKSALFESDFDYRRFNMMLVEFAGGYDKYKKLLPADLEKCKISLMIATLFSTDELKKLNLTTVDEQKVMLLLIKRLGGYAAYQKLKQTAVASTTPPTVLQKLGIDLTTFEGTRRLLILINHFGSYDELLAKASDPNFFITNAEAIIAKQTGNTALIKRFNIDQNLILANIGDENKVPPEYFIEEHDVVKSFKKAAGIESPDTNKISHPAFYKRSLEKGKLVRIKDDTIWLHGGINLKSFIVPIFSRATDGIVTVTLKNFHDPEKGIILDSPIKMQEWAQAMNDAYAFAISHPDQKLCQDFIMTLSIKNSDAKLADSPFAGNSSTIADIRMPGGLVAGVEDAFAVLSKCGINVLNAGHTPVGTSPAGAKLVIAGVEYNITDSTYGGGAAIFLTTVRQKDGSIKTQRMMVDDRISEHPIELSGAYKEMRLKFDPDKLVDERLTTDRTKTGAVLNNSTILLMMFALLPGKDTIKIDEETLTVTQCLEKLNKFFSADTVPTPEEIAEIRKIIVQVNAIFADRPINISNAKVMDQNFASNESRELMQFRTDKMGYEVNGNFFEAGTAQQLFNAGHLEFYDPKYKDETLPAPLTPVAVSTLASRVATRVLDRLGLVSTAEGLDPFAEAVKKIVEKTANRLTATFQAIFQEVKTDKELNQATVQLNVLKKMVQASTSDTANQDVKDIVANARLAIIANQTTAVVAATKSTVDLAGRTFFQSKLPDATTAYANSKQTVSELIAALQLIDLREASGLEHVDPAIITDKLKIFIDFLQGIQGDIDNNTYSGDELRKLIQDKMTALNIKGFYTVADIKGPIKNALEAVVDAYVNAAALKRRISTAALNETVATFNKHTSDAADNVVDASELDTFRYAQNLCKAISASIGKLSRSDYLNIPNVDAYSITKTNVIISNIVKNEKQSPEFRIGKIEELQTELLVIENDREFSAELKPLVMAVLKAAIAKYKLEEKVKEFLDENPSIASNIELYEKLAASQTQAKESTSRANSIIGDRGLPYIDGNHASTYIPIVYTDALSVLEVAKKITEHSTNEDAKDNINTLILLIGMLNKATEFEQKQQFFSQIQRIFQTLDQPASQKMFEDNPIIAAAVLTATEAAIAGFGVEQKVMQFVPSLSYIKFLSKNAEGFTAKLIDPATALSALESAMAAKSDLTKAIATYKKNNPTWEQDEGTKHALDAAQTELDKLTGKLEPFTKLETATAEVLKMVESPSTLASLTSMVKTASITSLEESRNQIYAKARELLSRLNEAKGLSNISNEDLEKRLNFLINLCKDEKTSALSETNYMTLDTFNGMERFRDNYLDNDIDQLNLIADTVDAPIKQGLLAFVSALKQVHALQAQIDKKKARAEAPSKLPTLAHTLANSMKNSTKRFTSRRGSSGSTADNSSTTSVPSAAATSESKRPTVLKTIFDMQGEYKARGGTSALIAKAKAAKAAKAAQKLRDAELKRQQVAAAARSAPIIVPVSASTLTTAQPTPAKPAAAAPPPEKAAVPPPLQNAPVKPLAPPAAAPALQRLGTPEDVVGFVDKTRKDNLTMKDLAKTVHPDDISSITSRLTPTELLWVTESTATRKGTFEDTLTRVVGNTADIYSIHSGHSSKGGMLPSFRSQKPSHFTVNQKTPDGSITPALTVTPDGKGYEVNLHGGSQESFELVLHGLEKSAEHKYFNFSLGNPATPEKAANFVKALLNVFSGDISKCKLEFDFARDPNTAYAIFKVLQEGNIKKPDGTSYPDDKINELRTHFGFKLDADTKKLVAMKPGEIPATNKQNATVVFAPFMTHIKAEEAKLKTTGGPATPGGGGV